MTETGRRPDPPVTALEDRRRLRSSAFSPDQLELYATCDYQPMRLARRDLVGNTESIRPLKVP